MTNNSFNSRDGQETQTKMKHFQSAIERGELDHLHQDQSFHPKYIRLLWRIADEATKEPTIEGSQDEKLQSIITTAHTLCSNGQIENLYEALKERFPEYFFSTRF